jgi:flagellar biosynthesis anti-sigma factor FlgM
MATINGIGNTNAPAGIAAKGKIRADSAPGNPVTGTKSAGDRLELSDIVNQVKEAPEFDTGKVEQIKASIKNGNYPVDAKAIAKGFAELEQLLSDRSSGT